MKLLTLNNALLTLLAMVAVAVFGYAFSGYALTAFDSGPPVDEPYPFPLSPEFPTVDRDDEATLLAAAEELVHAHWHLEELTVLTRGGQRVGIVGMVEAHAPILLPEQVDYRYCGRRLSPGESYPPAATIGLYLALVDGASEPYYLLPYTDEGHLPTLTMLGDEMVRQPCPTNSQTGS